MAVSYRVATRYAKSLYDQAIEKGALDAVKADMESLTLIVEENREFELVLESPIITSSKKLDVLNAVYKGTANQITSNFFSLVTSKNRTQDLSGIAKAFIKLYNQNKGIQNAIVTTTFPIDSDLIVQFENKVKSITGCTTVNLENVVDESLIAGYVLSIDDRQIDASVKSKLNNVRSQFNK